MNISNVSYNGLARVDLKRTSGGSQGTPTEAASDASHTLAGSQALGQDVQAHLQTAATALQVSAGYVDQVQDILGQMAAMAAAPSGASATEFSGLQDTLAQATGATLGGAALFDGTAGASPYTPSTPSSAPIDLQSDAIASLVTQNPAGGFALGVADTGTAGTILAAQQQASGAAAALAGSLTAVQAAAQAAEASTGAGALSTSESAWSATAAAAKALGGTWTQALGAFEPSSLSSAVGLL